MLWMPEAKTAIGRFEANLQPVAPGKTPSSTESLYWRSVKREKERKACALKKQQDYH